MGTQNSYIQEWERLFAEHRSYLISFAFRMTGSLSEAEDIVQDVFIECAEVNPTSIQNPKSWLTKVCSNRALDHLKLAYKKRETYPGTWLPDAVPDSFQIWGNLANNDSPDKNILLSQSLTTSFLLLIEKLTPEERVVYLLNEVFEYPFKDIAEVLKKSEEACRKIAERARKAVLSGRSKFVPQPVGAEKVIAQFFDLAKQGNSAGLMDLLAEGSEFWSDGGGKVAAVRDVVTDTARIAEFFKGVWTSKFFKGDDYKVEYQMVNLLPGVVISRKSEDGWVFETIMSFEIQDGKIVRIYSQRNPDKLNVLTKIQ
ncbi:RNA polymerase sigma factor SigJ [Bdellovibrio sp. 22V]|uniref:RNA polymerase sigma factor SigJ n=1 Tax=Bdellovibrio sp. 22V TaxID=3044166 RepID=UPI0025438128|nr:RNA polymerase sigma factor SigJ [Bdellovibrio sp. 22V]WII72140.1 RNA polymerase sigma factor SigJ [Bdellovibrio sp. 22V]